MANVNEIQRWDLIIRRTIIPRFNASTGYSLVFSIIKCIWWLMEDWGVGIGIPCSCSIWVERSRMRKSLSIVRVSISMGIPRRGEWRKDSDVSSLAVCCLDLASGVAMDVIVDSRLVPLFKLRQKIESGRVICWRLNIIIRIKLEFSVSNKQRF